MDSGNNFCNGLCLAEYLTKILNFISVQVILMIPEGEIASNTIRSAKSGTDI